MCASHLLVELDVLLEQFTMIWSKKSTAQMAKQTVEELKMQDTGTTCIVEL